MLQTLTVKNYALIQSLKIDFKNGFSVITGETGAGKSIILGAMHLMLGQRADISVMKDTNQKCIVEGVFEVSAYQLQSIFAELDLDYWEETIIRREITPAGKSRAFINDTPVNLSTLKSITSRLIDIHSQQQNSEIDDRLFQLNVIDSSANCKPLRESFKTQFQKVKKLEKQLEELKEKARLAAAEQEFHQFQFEQLEKANLQAEEEEQLEEEQQMLSHAEEIKSALESTSHLLENDEGGALSQITEALKSVENIENFSGAAKEIAARLSSVKIELDDLLSETQRLSDNVEYDPSKLEFINERLSLIFDLKHRHHVESVTELIEIKSTLEKQLQETGNLEMDIEKRSKEIKAGTQEMEKLAGELTTLRKSAFSTIETYITEHLRELGMPNSQFKIELKRLPQFNAQGWDEIRFLFSANKSMPLQEMSAVASGGEKSRLMLVIKSLLAKTNSLPTIIFDEIDTGVSGEIAQKIAHQITQLSSHLQVLVITHLPQVASKGTHHFKVYKQETNDATLTSIKPLNSEERILEIAELLSGKNPSEAAIQNAKELMNG